MDIFKLFYEHDLRLDDLAERSTGKEPRTELSIEDFMKPIPTYSKFYLTGTHLDDERFGINAIEQFPHVLSALDQALSEYNYYLGSEPYRNLGDVLETAQTGDAIIMAGEQPATSSSMLNLQDHSNVGHLKEELREVLSSDLLVLYKEQAHHGFDLHLFSRDNIYKSLFYPLRDLVSEDFRFFSINGKRIQSERKFYFETWTLDRPPHGAEEVFGNTEL